MDKWHRSGLALAAGFAVAALVVRVAAVGYEMTALVLLGLGAVTAFFTWAHHAHRKKLMLWTAAALCVCFGLFLAAEIPVVDGAQSDADTDADFLVVMGAGVDGTEPSQSMLDRLEAALDWLDAHPDARVIVSGSQGPNEVVSEASVMAAWLTQNGIAPERIIMEEEATSTRENVINSYVVAVKNGGGRVAFVSSEYHLCRIRMLIRSLGFEPACVAAKTGHITLAVNYFIREAFAIWQIWVFGIDA